MQFKKAALSVAALAMPLTALAAAPANASEDKDHDHGYYHEAEAPKVYIKAVKVHRGDIKVVVAYKCDTSYGKHDDKVKHGHLRVVLTQKKAVYAGHQQVECDNEWSYAKVELEKKYGRLRTGHAHLKAVLKDPQGDKAYDHEKVRVIVKKHGDKDHDKKH
jgi:hypothetical protein